MNPNSASIDGNATLTIDASSTVMNSITASIEKGSQGLRALARSRRTDSG